MVLDTDTKIELTVPEAKSSTNHGGSQKQQSPIRNIPNELIPGFMRAQHDRVWHIKSGTENIQEQGDDKKD